MPLFWFKAAVATILLALGLTAARTMLKLMGTPQPAAPAAPRESATAGDPAAALRKRHKSAGRRFGLALAVLAAAGLYHWGRTGDAVPERAVLHVYFAMALAALYLLKLAIARRYRQYLRYAAPLGLTLATLMLVVYAGSAGYYVLHAALAARDPRPAEASSGLSAEAERGRTIFAGLCSDCHYADRESKKIGPGLKGLLKRPALPESGRPATPENVLSQLKKPFRAMPSFARLSEAELDELVAYLQTL